MWGGNTGNKSKPMFSPWDSDVMVIELRVKALDKVYYEFLSYKKSRLDLLITGSEMRGF